MSTGERGKNFTLFCIVVSPGVMLWLKVSLKTETYLMVDLAQTTPAN